MQQTGAHQKMIMVKNPFVYLLLLLLFCSCSSPAVQETQPAPQKKATAPEPSDDTPAQPLARVQVPVLCYHHIRKSIQGHAPDYSISTAMFAAHIKMLQDSGYQTILPNELYEHLNTGSALPPKPIVISFDDGHAEHYTTAAPVLEQHQFRGVFFIQGVVIGKQNYITPSQISDLVARGHAIAAHSWDHPDLRKITHDEKAMAVQLTKTKSRLEGITGQTIDYLAYPNGAWNDAVVAAVKQSGYKAAFQLTQKQSDTAPLFSIRRIMVAGNWSAAALQSRIMRY